MLLTDARVVAAEGVLERGWVRVADGRITDVGTGPPPDDRDRTELPGRHLVPGFVDLHVHGGGGHSTLSPDPEEIDAAASFHRRHGTIRTLVSIATAPIDEMVEALSAAAQLTAAGQILGAHLEGPFLNPVRAGAHDPRHLLAPDPNTLDRLVGAADGALRVMTLAPELPGGLDLVRRIRDAGIVAAIGHSDADYATTTRAFEAGATLVTHLFNGMRPMHHREPGVAGAALADPSVTCELINDGVHVHDAAARLAFTAATDRVALVTDATAAAGDASGTYRLAGVEIRVSDGAPRLADGVTLAGSTLTMDMAVRRAVHELGVPLPMAVAAASRVPAHVLGIADEAGSIEAGRAADLVVLDDALEVEAVMLDGRWITSGRLFHT
jgi:N-acetylglucosamine-6-phosphate deacetylase